MCCVVLKTEVWDDVLSSELLDLLRRSVAGLDVDFFNGCLSEILAFSEGMAFGLAIKSGFSTGRERHGACCDLVSAARRIIGTITMMIII